MINFFSSETQRDKLYLHDDESKMEEAKTGDGAKDIDEGRAVDYPFSPPANHGNVTDTGAAMRRQIIPELGLDGDTKLQIQRESARVNLSGSCRADTPHAHAGD